MNKLYVEGVTKSVQANGNAVRYFKNDLEKIKKQFKEAGDIVSKDLNNAFDDLYVNIIKSIEAEDRNPERITSSIKELENFLLDIDKYLYTFKLYADQWVKDIREAYIVYLNKKGIL